jgi:hypothetical protein
VAADYPFAAEKGQLKKARQALADKLMSNDSFQRVVDGKKVQNCFSALVHEHQKFDAESARLSGSDQEKQRQHVLMDLKLFGNCSVREVDPPCVRVTTSLRDDRSVAVVNHVDP